MFLRLITSYASRYPSKTLLGGRFFDSFFVTINYILTYVLTIFQDKVYDEIYSVLGDSDRDVTPDDVFRFKYLEMVLKETLRLFPPGAIFSRKISKNIKLSKYTNRVLVTDLLADLTDVGRQYL